jgi:ribosomal protein S6|eukprot:COSAG01_NODE_947_length_12532_cov_15.427388_5_plen_68_part_00
MPAYETTVMISTLTSRRRTIDLLKRLVNHVLDNKGVVTSITSLGDRALAYDIRKNKVPPGPARNNPL